MTRTTEDVYATYRIPPNLQMHQLRVAAVGTMICDSLDTSVDRDRVVKTCLFHDMGNIIKFDFAQPLLSDDPQGIPHWRTVQREFIEQYGTDEHKATKEIAHEIGLSDEIVACIDAIGFSKLEHTRDNASLEQKIAQYADLRVTPTGVASLDERVEEARRRYAARSGDDMGDEERFARLLNAAHEVEKQVFAHASIRSEDITEASVQSSIPLLRSMIVA